MSDTANARKIIAGEFAAYRSQTDKEAYFKAADTTIAALAAHGLEIRPIAPAAGKDVGEEELEARCLQMLRLDEGVGLKEIIAFLRPPLIQQGLREAAGICDGRWIAACNEIRARIDAMGKGEE